MRGFLGARHVELLLVGICVSWNEILQSGLLTMIKGGFINYNITANHPLEKEINKLSPAARINLDMYYYILSPISCLLGGVLSLKVNNKYVILCLCFMTSCLNLAMPILFITLKATGCIILAVFSSIAKGMFEPLLMNIIANWTPSTEIGISIVIIFQVCRSSGDVFCGTVAAVIINYVGLANFIYFIGASGLVWCFIWFIFGAQDPMTCFFISKEELNYIYQKIEWKKMPACENKVPWKGIFKCPLILGIAMADVSFNWAFWTMSFPEIVEKLARAHMTGSESDIQVHKRHVITVSVLVPCSMLVYSYIAERLIYKLNWPKNHCRKIINSIAFWGSAFSISYMLYLNHSLLTFHIVFLFFASLGETAGFRLTVFDITPTYTGFVQGLIVFPRYCSLILFKKIFYFMVIDIETAAFWISFFNISVFLLFVGNWAFVIAGDIQRQAFDEGGLKRERESIISYPDIRLF